MRRRALVICLTLALAACGDDDDDDAGSGGGGPGPGATAITVTGPLATQATNASAVSGTASCFGVAANYLAIGASSFADLCSLAQTGDEKANETIVNVAIATLNPLGSPARSPLARTRSGRPRRSRSRCSSRGTTPRATRPTSRASPAR